MLPVSDVIPSRRTPYVTIALIAFNTIGFAAQLLLGRDASRLADTLGLVPAFLSWPAVITGMFLHAGWLPFLASMLYLWIFGDNVEGRLGHGRFALFYVLCGAAAALAHVAFHPHSLTPTVGAGGAVSGLLGAYVVLYPRSRVLTAVFLVVMFDLVEIPARFFVGLWFLLQLASGIGARLHAAAGVAFGAHLIAFAFGATCALAWRFRARANP